MDYRLRVLLKYALALLLSSWFSTANGSNVELNNFKPMSEYDTSWLDWDTLRLKKISRNELGISGDCELKQNLGNEQRVTIQIYNYDPEAKRRGPIVFQMDKSYCEMVESMMDTYNGLAAASNLPDEFRCPFPKDKYTFDNYVLDTDFLKEDTPKGDYLMSILLKNGDKAVSGFEVNLSVT